MDDLRSPAEKYLTPGQHQAFMRASIYAAVLVIVGLGLVPVLGPIVMNPLLGVSPQTAREISDDPMNVYHYAGFAVIAIGLVVGGVLEGQRAFRSRFRTDY